MSVNNKSTPCVGPVALAKSIKAVRADITAGTRNIHQKMSGANTHLQTGLSVGIISDKLRLILFVNTAHWNHCAAD